MNVPSILDQTLKEIESQWIYAQSTKDNLLNIDYPPAKWLSLFSHVENFNEQKKNKKKVLEAMSRLQDFICNHDDACILWHLRTKTKTQLHFWTTELMGTYKGKILHRRKLDSEVTYC